MVPPKGFNKETVEKYLKQSRENPYLANTYRLIAENGRDALQRKIAKIVFSTGFFKKEIFG